MKACRAKYLYWHRSGRLMRAGSSPPSVVWCSTWGVKGRMLMLFWGESFLPSIGDHNGSGSPAAALACVYLVQQQLAWPAPTSCASRMTNWSGQRPTSFFACAQTTSCSLTRSSIRLHRSWYRLGQWTNLRPKHSPMRGWYLPFP